MRRSDWSGFPRICSNCLDWVDLIGTDYFEIRSKKVS